MAMTIEGADITISRGNAAGLTIHLEGEDVPSEGTIALVSLKKTLERSIPIWQKRIPVHDNAIDIMFTHKDTDHEPGDYYWDVCILYNEGANPWTLMDHPARFRIGRVVGNAT